MNSPRSGPWPCSCRSRHEINLAWTSEICEHGRAGGMFQLARRSDLQIGDNMSRLSSAECWQGDFTKYLDSLTSDHAHRSPFCCFQILTGFLQNFLTVEYGSLLNLWTKLDKGSIFEWIFSYLCDKDKDIVKFCLCPSGRKFCKIKI